LIGGDQVFDDRSGDLWLCRQRGGRDIASGDLWLDRRRQCGGRDEAGHQDHDGGDAVDVHFGRRLNCTIGWEV
jgi:hypothetical protein